MWNDGVEIGGGRRKEVAEWYANRYVRVGDRIHVMFVENFKGSGLGREGGTWEGGTPGGGQLLLTFGGDGVGRCSFDPVVVLLHLHVFEWRNSTIARHTCPHPTKTPEGSPSI